MGLPERALWEEAMGMDADTIGRIRPALTEYLHVCDGCFGRIAARRHLDTYVEGQLSDLPRKSVEPMADAAGTPPPQANTASIARYRPGSEEPTHLSVELFVALSY